MNSISGMEFRADDKRWGVLLTIKNTGHTVYNFIVNDDVNALTKWLNGRASEIAELIRPGESAQVPPELEHNGERTDCQVVGPLPASGGQPTTSRSTNDRPKKRDNQCLNCDSIMCLKCPIL